MVSLGLVAALLTIIFYMIDAFTRCFGQLQLPIIHGLPLVRFQVS